VEREEGKSLIGNFIVSLASYSKRISTLNVCLESIFSQTLMPQKVLLYLDDSIAFNKIPKEIIAYIPKGLEIIRVSNDITSHNKYYYTLQNFPDDAIITVDDDVIYDKYTFYNLWCTHQKFPSAVCATKVTYMTFDNDKIIRSYNDWISEYDKIHIPSKQLVAVGVGGILYPPHTFSSETFDKKLIMKLAPTADDLWLKIMQLQNNIPVVWTGQLPQHPTQIPGTRDVGLWRTINKYKNDEYIQKLINYYGLNLFSLVTKEG
jgi:hypothetical protein